MNTFQQLIGKDIIEVLRMDAGENPSSESLLAVFLKLTSDSGLNIGHSFEHDLTSIRYMSIEDVQYGDIAMHFGTCLAESRFGDSIALLNGDILRNLSIGEVDEPQPSGSGFVLKSDKFTGIKIDTNNHSAFFFYDKDHLKVYVDQQISHLDITRWTLT